MRQLLLFAVLILFTINSNAQDSLVTTGYPDPQKKLQVVEASCGQCNFGMRGKGCRLAIRIDGHSYFVDGTDIDSHGDAHAADGFCEAIRKAEVQGTVIDTLFHATYFKLLEEPGKNSK